MPICIWSPVMLYIILIGLRKPRTQYSVVNNSRKCSYSVRYFKGMLLLSRMLLQSILFYELRDWQNIEITLPPLPTWYHRWWNRKIK